MKKIMILTVTAGNGHNACSRGMKNKLEQKGDCEVRIVDLLKEFSTKWDYWVNDKGYNLVAAHLLFAYNYFFNKNKRKKPEDRNKGLAQNWALNVVSGLLKEIYEWQPDVIYSAHYLGAVAITDLKMLYDIPCRTIVANLDYVNSPFWECCNGVDYFVIPNEDFIEECVYEGFKPSQLLPLGIPNDGRTLEKIDKVQARRQLGLDEDTFTIMVLFGGGAWKGGFKIFKDLIKALKGRKAQVIMINGRDKAGYEKIQKMKFDENIKVLNVGFTHDVPLYISAADIMLNKFGGTSVTDMINKEIPMLITEKIPAQEKYNLIYMKKKGVALSFKNARQMRENLYKLMDDESLRQSMIEKMIPMKKNATEDTANFILSSPNADYTNVKPVNYKKVRKEIRARLKVEHRLSKAQARENRKMVVAH